jgi:predicted alpha/beta-hydrolase family hydrolase
MAAPPLAFVEEGPAEAGATLVLAHGAGAPMDSRFMDWWSSALGERGVRVVRFEFPYMRLRRASGGRRPPDREPVLLDTWREVAARWRGAAIGGKSMGGRIASMVAEEVGAAALVCLGYPFHAPGRPETPRIAHLREFATPALIVQGANDPFGRREEIAEYGLAPGIQFAWVDGGNHDLERRGEAPEATWQASVDRVARFVLEHAGRPGSGRN